LSDGRTFGQIIQNSPQKISIATKKLVAVKYQNLAKSGRKEAGKYKYNNVIENELKKCSFSQLFLFCMKKFILH
jgi:hypothetical protein